VLLQSVLGADQELTTKNFTSLLGHIPRIAPENNNPTNTYTFGKIMKLYSQEWFHGEVSSDQTEFRLKNLPERSWLIRFSSRFVGAFALSVLGPKEKTHTWLLTAINGTELNISSEKKKTSFKDIFELVEYYKTNPLPESDNPTLGQVCICLDDKLEMQTEIGKGNFGSVFKALWRRGDSEPTIVAAKLLASTLKDSKAQEANQIPLDVQAEANLNKLFDHENVVKFLGISVTRGAQYIVSEFMGKGSVHSFLCNSKKQDISPLVIVKMATDTTKGMDYLHRQNIIHRDLAARNLLMSEVNGKYVIKVSDFGLSRAVAHGNYYVKSGQSSDPVRWAAPEAFPHENEKGHLSERSDRWSFGIVLYELFVFCKEIPYPNLVDTREVKKALHNRDDMSQYLPLDDVPDGICEIIRKCLNYTSTDRPSFKQLEQLLTDIEKKLEDETLNVWKTNDKENTNDLLDSGYDN